MLETKEQKQIFAGSIVLIVILGVVSLWNRPNLKYQDTTDYAALQQKYNEGQLADNQYLASLDTSEAAQKSIVNQLLPEAEVKAAVEKELDASQTISLPIIADSQIKISSMGGKSAVEGYMAVAGPIFEKLKMVTDAGTNDVFNPSGDSNRVDSLIVDANAALNQFKKIPAPKEVVKFHKQLIVGLQTYLDLLQTSKNYTINTAVSPWPKTYKDYVIIGKTLATAGAEFTTLNQKYNLLGSTEQEPIASGNFLAPKASAQLATIDVWQKAQEALSEIAATSIARFMLAFLDKLATKIEDTYRVSNFLYYSDALVSGQYIDDYLNKYVGDSLDKAMIKNFIPEISCGNNKDFSKAFMAKANQHLGFDPAALDPKDPDYYAKLARVGDFLSSPNGWQITYQDAAASARSSAQSAANNEINSPGHKAGRDETGNIITSVEVSLDAMKAIFQRYLTEGSDIGGFTTTQQITSQITQAFLNNFVLKGVVLEEQKTCISVPQVQLVTQIP